MNPNIKLPFRLEDQPLYESVIMDQTISNNSILESSPSLLDQSLEPSSNAMLSFFKSGG